MIGPSEHLSALYSELALPELPIIFRPIFPSPVFLFGVQLVFIVAENHHWDIATPRQTLCLHTPFLVL